MIQTEDIASHPINSDESLGQKPSFLEVPLSRPVVYMDDGGVMHSRLFDGRPGSDTFTGVTPTEVRSIIEAESKISWGCYLDGGQTAKLVVNNGSDIASYGNRHYLRWPAEVHGEYVWVPDAGRPSASAITVQ